MKFFLVGFVFFAFFPIRASEFNLSDCEKSCYQEKVFCRSKIKNIPFEFQTNMGQELSDGINSVYRVEPPGCKKTIEGLFHPVERSYEVNKKNGCLLVLYSLLECTLNQLADG